MLSRLQLWMVLFAFVCTAAVRAQAPAAAPANAPMPPGQIKAVKVTGVVNVLLNGQSTVLHESDPVPQAASVVTEKDSSAILVFSNGATMQLGAETTLVINQFLQNPFSAPATVATMTEEPSISHTRLHLVKGELIGNVKHLHHDKGSTFTIDTPVGAAGIRGTTFRIIFRPSGTGAAFAVYSIQTVEGNVVYTNPDIPAKSSTSAPSGQRGGSVAVTTGQEVVVTVSVETDPKTGQVVVTAPIQLATTTPLNPVVRASIVSEATTMAKTVEETGTVFTSPPATSGGTSSGPASSPSSTTPTESTSTNSTPTESTPTETKTDGPKSSGPASSGLESTLAASTQTSSIAPGKAINTSPGFTSTPNTLTPGAGS